MAVSWSLLLKSACLRHLSIGGVGGFPLRRLTAVCRATMESVHMNSLSAVS